MISISNGYCPPLQDSSPELLRMNEETYWEDPCISKVEFGHLDLTDLSLYYTSNWIRRPMARALRHLSYSVLSISKQTALRMLSFARLVL
jgi:hypothetical protein